MDRNKSTIKHNCVVRMPIRIIAYQIDELEEEIAPRLKELEAKGGLVDGLRLLSTRKKTEKVSRQCEKFRQEYLKKWMGLFKKKEDQKLKRKYIDRISDYLQRKLKLEFDVRVQKERHKELGNIVCYFLTRGEEPHEDVRKIICRLSYPLYNHVKAEYNYRWYGLCCQMLCYNDETFARFYGQLSQTAFEYLIYQQPQILLNKESHLLVKKLTEHLPYSNLHQMLIGIRNRKGQTHMFLMTDWHSIPMYVRQYVESPEDLYDLLSISDANGQTALHVNTGCVTRLLTDLYKPMQRDLLIKLTSMKDHFHKTALEVAGQSSRSLTSLMERVAENRYVTDTRWITNILIIYNTKTRPGADDEAQMIYNACLSKFEEATITVRRNKNKDEMVELIKYAANERDIHGQLKALIVILASHGSVGAIHDCNGEPVELSHIEDAMCSDQLDGRPKLLIAQCCQLGDASEETPPYVPIHQDFCAVLPCVAGQASDRGVLLSKLAEQIENSANNTNIFEIFSMASKKMRFEGRQQKPIIMSTLKAGFCPTDWWVQREAPHSNLFTDFYLSTLH